MFIRIFGIFVLVLCGGNLSAVLNRKHVSNETSKCFNRNKFMKLQKAQIPRVETAVNIAQDVNITASFHVELKEDNVITGSIKWIFNKDEDMTNLIVRLSFVNNQVETTDYFLIHVDSRSIEHNGSRYANMNCIKVPPTTNTTIIAELHRINLTSCGCDITDLNITYCLHLCHMYHVSTHTFLSSRDACYCYRERNQDELRMNLKAEMISTNFTRFRGYFSNVNPYLIARVSIFPEDIDHSPHVPILTLPVKVNAEREIYFSGVSQSLGFSEFYAMLTVSCSEGEIPDHFSSHTARARPYEEEHNSQHSEKFDSGLGGNIEKNTDDSVKIDVVVYGMVTGLIGVCCIVTVIVWLKCFRGKKRRTENIRRSCDAGRDLQVEPYTPSKWYSERQITRSIVGTMGISKREKDVMILYHPDTKIHKTDVDNLTLCLQKYDIQVHDKPETAFQNWRDFAEKAGEDYKDVIIVLSWGLIELCEIYKKKGYNVDNKTIYDKESVSISDKDLIDKRWNELLEQRHGEYIPCVALDKVRSVIQDRQSDIGMHFVTFCDSQTDSSDVCDGEKNDIVDHHESDALLNCLNIHSDISKHHDNDEPTTCNKSPNYNDHWDFIKHCTFLQTKSIKFHTISRKVLKYLLLSETETNVTVNTMHSLSLSYILKNLR